MSSKASRMLMCAAIAVSLGMFGTATNATFYGGDFDPPDPAGHFTGNFLLDVSDGCGSEGPCTIDLISLLITSADFFGGGWFSNGQSNIASSASFSGGLHFDSVVIPLTAPFNVFLDFADVSFLSRDSVAAAPQPTCGAPSLKYTSFFDRDFLGHPGFIAVLGCFDGSEFVAGDNAVYIAALVPEPGTLALLVGGIGAAWLTRRRRTAA